LALKLKPNANGPSFNLEGIQDKYARAELEVVSDSKFGADQESRYVVFGWNLHFCRALISLTSNECNGVTLSSLKEKYFTLSKVTKEVMIVKQVLVTTGNGVKLSIITMLKMLKQSI
jgi:hypothetical protein